MIESVARCGAWHFCLFICFDWLYHCEVANGCACGSIARLHSAKEVVATSRKFFALAVGQVPHIRELRSLFSPNELTGSIGYFECDVGA